MPVRDIRAWSWVKLAQEILERYQRLSQPFGTNVNIDDNVGIVRM